MRRSLRSSVQWAGVLVVSLVLGEVALRVVHHYWPVFIFYDTAYSRFRGRPGSSVYGFPLNSSGFKDVDFDIDKGEHYRIAAIGDSFAFGVVPYEHNYLTLLEERLRHRCPRVELLNMGIPRMGPRDYLALLVTEALPLRPDMVLLSFFIGNDFLESGPIKHERRAWEYSYVATMVHYLFTIRPHYEGLPTMLTGYDDRAPTLDEKAYLKHEKHRAKVVIRSEERFAGLLDLAMGYVTEMKRLCSARDIDMVVVIIPDEFQVSPSLQRTLKLRRGGVDLARPNRMLAARLTEAGVPSVDLLDAFARRSRTESLYKPLDTHWNIAGNALAAEVIAPPLLTRVLPACANEVVAE